MKPRKPDAESRAVSTKFRKRPVTIDATQWWPGLAVDGVCTKPDVNTCFGQRDPNDVAPHVHTLEGFHLVSPGDWIITGVQGERYPCKPDIFDATYETAAKPTPAIIVAASESDAEVLRQAQEHRRRWHLNPIRPVDNALIRARIVGGSTHVCLPRAVIFEAIEARRAAVSSARRHYDKGTWQDGWADGVAAVVDELRALLAKHDGEVKP